MQFFTVFPLFAYPLAWASPLDHLQNHFAVGQVVQTSSGPVAGHAASGYPDVSEYLGIPFAQPPVGDLRFSPPVEYTGSALLNASTYVGDKLISVSPTR
jgi:hypothetical protein